MERQRALGEADLALPSALRSSYAGNSIDHSAGGRVSIAITNVAEAPNFAAHFAAFGVADIEIVEATLNDRALEELASATQLRLFDARAEGAQPSVEVGRGLLGRITVDFVDRPMSLVEAEVRAEAAADPKVFVLRERNELDTEDELNSECDITGNLECNAPLRGSVWIHEVGSGGVCTAGFNARSVSDNKAYVLTAGHCDDGSGVLWYTDWKDDSDHNIGSFWNSRRDSETDTGIIKVVDPTGWAFGNPWVTVMPSSPHSLNERYNISAVHNPGHNYRICVTAGNTVSTSCGTVTSTSQTNSFGTTGLIRVENLCTLGGDSGAPYYSYGVAYGIHISSPENVYCTFARGEHALEAASRMNVYIVES